MTLKKIKNRSDVPEEILSCASHVCALITGEGHEELTMKIFQRRVLTYGWNPSRARSSMLWMTCNEIRFLLRRYFKHTAARYPKKVTLHEFCKFISDPAKVYVVMVDIPGDEQHLVIVHKRLIYDTFTPHNNGRPNTGVFSTEHIYWYQEAVDPS